MANRKNLKRSREEDPDKYNLNKVSELLRLNNVSEHVQQHVLNKMSKENERIRSGYGGRKKKRKTNRRKTSRCKTSRRKTTSRRR